MKNRPKIIWGCLGSGVLGLLLTAIGAAIFWITLPEVSGQIPLAPTLLTLTQPYDGAQFPPNEPIPMEAQLVSANEVRALEWWVNGQLYESVQLDTQAGEARILYWAFTPGEASDYQVLARALESDGRSLDSNPVHIRIVEGTSGELPAQYLSQGEQTLEQIAAMLGSTPAQVLSKNPGLPQTGLLPAGTPIQAPLSAYSSDLPDIPLSLSPQQQAPPPPQSGSPPAPPPHKLLFWLGTFFPQPAPAAPVLTYSAQGCEVQLFIADQSENEQGFNLYRYDEKGARALIAQIGPAAAAGQTVEYRPDEVSRPAATYVAAAFNQGGEVLSNPVMTLPGEDCPPADPPQHLTLELFLTPETPMDRTYCYFAVNQGPWQRMPAHPEAFFVRTGSRFELGPALDAFSFLAWGDSLDLECWGWAGDDLQLLGQGRQSLAVAEADGSAALELGKAALDLSWQNGVQTLAEDKTLVVYLAPPTDLRVTHDPAECASHFGSGIAAFLASFVCGGLIKPDGGVITHDVLVWEWQASNGCFPQPNQVCLNIAEPDGYYLYKIPILLLPGYNIEIPENLAPLQHIPNSGQKVVALPLPWALEQDYASWCYGVAAYKDVFGEEKQEFSNILCYGINYP